MQASIYVADDEPALLNAILKRLSKTPHKIRGFKSGDELLAAALQDMPDLVLVDMKMPGRTGLETLEALRAKSREVVVIILTAYGTVEEAVEAMKLGAYDFIIKSVDLGAVEPVVTRAMEHIVLRRRLAYAAENQASEYGLDTFASGSPVMASILSQVREVAQNPKTNVLLLGEVGTGKGFLAQVIHHNSTRAKSPFIRINCTSISPQHFERDLFGYERGAFAGAEQRKIGLLEQSEDGALYLDEVADLNLAMQGKLLGVLQDRAFRRLGGSENIPVDFRVITSTYRDLKQEVSAGRFRDDLYFLLNVISIVLPPLRERVGDILPLARRFLAKYAVEIGKEVVDIDPKAIAILEQYSYPGNVRELQNIMERAVMLCTGKTLTAGDLPGARQPD